MHVYLPEIWHYCSKPDTPLNVVNCSQCHCLDFVSMEKTKSHWDHLPALHFHHPQDNWLNICTVFMLKKGHYCVESKLINNKKWAEQRERTDDSRDMESPQLRMKLCFCSIVDWFRLIKEQSVERMPDLHHQNES